MRKFQLERTGDDYSNELQSQKLANKTLTPQTREGLFSLKIISVTKFIL